MYTYNYVYVTRLFSEPTCVSIVYIRRLLRLDSEFVYIVPCEF